MIIIYSLVTTVKKIIHSWNLTQITWGKKWNILKGRHWPLREENRLCSNLNWYHLTWNGYHPTYENWTIVQPTFHLLPMLIKHTRHSVVMQYTNQSHLKAATTVSDFPDSSPLLAVLKCLKDKVKCGRLHKAFLWWFSEKQKKGFTFSYGFTRLESKYFCWHFASLI